MAVDDRRAVLCVDVLFDRRDCAADVFTGEIAGGVSSHAAKRSLPMSLCRMPSGSASVAHFIVLAANLAIAAALLAWFAYANDWRITLWEAVPAFVISLVLVSIFSIAIPQSLAKYAGEKFLAHTFTLLQLFVVLAIPILVIVQALRRIDTQACGHCRTCRAMTLRRKRKKSF